MQCDRLYSLFKDEETCESTNVISFKRENSMIEKTQTLGLKDMHRMQVNALMEYVGMRLS